jgi:hypothetical protein
MIEAFFLLLAAGTPQAAIDSLAAARAGKLQCSGPNVEKKTCMAFSSYKVASDNSFESTVTILISPNPLITMTVKSTGKFDGGGACGPIRKSDFEAGTFQMDGKPVDEALANTIRPQIVASVAPLDGKTGCAKEIADGATARVDVTVDGVARPEMTQRAIWVKPDEGYKIGM